MRRPSRVNLLSSVCVPVRCRPLSRPRLTKGRVYQPLKNQFELLEAMDHCFMPIVDPVIVDVNFLFRGHGKHEWPVQRAIGDEDNLRKAVCDALVKRGYIPSETFAKSALKPNTAVDKVVVDLYGLNDAEKELVKATIRNGNPTKPIEFLE
jgi:hypothetical protein